MLLRLSCLGALRGWPDFGHLCGANAKSSPKSRVYKTINNISQRATYSFYPCGNEPENQTHNTRTTSAKQNRKLAYS